MRKKNKQILIVSIIIAVALISLIYLQSNKTLNTAPPSGSYIQVPTYMWYKCEIAPSNFPPVLDKKDIPSSGIVVSCPANVKTCSIELHGEAGTILQRIVSYQVCDKNTNVCQSATTKNIGDFIISYFGSNIPVVKLVDLGNNQKISIRYYKMVGIGSLVYPVATSGSSVWVSGQPYIITKNSIFSGAGIPYTTVEQGCTIPTSGQSNLLQSFSGLVGWASNTQTTTSSSTMAFEETRNFVDNFVPISVENNKIVNNGNGYCSGDNIYPIASVTTNSGTYKVVDLSGKYVNEQPVTCCPGDVKPDGSQKCSSNFRWEDMGGSQCSLFDPCSPDSAHAIPSGTAKELMWSTCVNGYCIKQTSLKECTSDYDCVGNSKGSYCDRKTWTCTLVPVPVCPTSCSSDTDCSPCGNYKCENNQCVSGGGGGGNNGNGSNGDCKSCSEWAFNFFKPEDKKCDPQAVTKPMFSWNPLSWVTGGSMWIINQTGLTNQSLLCPFYISMLVLVGGVILIIIMILVAVGFSLKRLVKGIGKKKR